jgi:hypothetical protein
MTLSRASFVLFFACIHCGTAYTGLTISVKGKSLLCLDLYGGDTRNGSPLQLWECNGHQSQLWLFEAGKYAIQYAADPSKCVDAGSMSQGTKLQIWDCNGLKQQNLGFDPKEGTIYLSQSNADSPLASLCFDAYAPTAQGNAIQVWGCNAQPQQQWNVQWGTSIRVDQEYKMCLDLSGGKTDNGTPLQLWGCNGLTNQQWIVNGGAIQFAGDTTKCIDAFSPPKAGNTLQLWDCNGGAQQKFGYDKNMKTLYMSATRSLAANRTNVLKEDVEAPLASFCLDVPGGQVTAGDKLDVWNCNGCWNQQWTVAVAQGLTEDTVEGSAAGDIETHDQLQSPRSGLSAPYDNCPPKPGPPGPPGPGPGPGPQGPPCTATGGWPKFANQAALQGSPWAAYFTAVYGAVPTSQYPICLSDFHMMYSTAMTKAGVQAPGKASTCPSGKSKGAPFTSEIDYPKAYPGAVYLLQPPPYTDGQFAANSWIEVMHGVGAGVIKDETIGAWFYWLKGSGIWYNIGKKISFNDHGNADSHFKSKAGKGLTRDEAMSKAAAAAGYDSVIYLGHSDVGTCPHCCKSLGYKNILVEVVAVKLVGKFACAGPGGSGVKAGWQGARACGCKDCGKSCFINCQGLPTLFMTKFGRWSNMTSIMTDSMLIV